ncbi:MAG: hypothetical protein K0S32_4045 [Bacteroidetes bacterium]|jgi:hypothetical protein|nr:hypothetical protein [Bacteroidota bacterium]
MKFERVIEKLKEQGFDAKIVQWSSGKITWDKLLWQNGRDECYVMEEDIAIEGNNIAWFQSSFRDNFLLNLYENGELFQWEPEMHNPAFGCICYLLEFYRGYLIFVYREKHEVYICSVKNKKVNYFKFHGELMNRKDDRMSFETYMNKPDGKVRVIKIPELIEVEPIGSITAEETGLTPIHLIEVDLRFSS